MRYRLELSQASIDAGSLIYEDAFRVSLTNASALDVELRYDGLVTTGGVFHTAPVLPLRMGTGATQQFSVSVTPDGPLIIDGALQLDFHFDVSADIAARNGYGPMIRNGLIANAYHTEVGRGGYFHSNSGTSEGQGVMILASLLAYEALRDDPADAEVARYYLELGESMLAAMSEYDGNGAMLRQPIPDNPNTLTLIHWLFAAKGPVRLQHVVLDAVVTLTGGQATIPASQMGHGVVNVWKLYPVGSSLLYPSPFSPVIGGGEIAVNSFTDNPNGSMTLTASAASGQYRVVYAYYADASLPLGAAYEAYPVWEALPDGYAACAPDTFRWFDMALDKAAELGAARNAAKWRRLRDALRRTAVKAQNLSDLRQVFRPMPKYGVFAPDGTFCYSDHPSALPGAAGMGENLWSRDTAAGGARVEVPLATSNPSDTGVSTTQIGRGFDDNWRAAAPYQDPDQFLLVEIGLRQNQSISPAVLAPPNFRPFISTQRDYSPETRYHADVGTAHNGEVWSWDARGEAKTLLYPRTAFKNSLGQVFPSGGRILNFGVDFSAPKTVGYSADLLEMRLVSGASAAAVTGDLTNARKGSKLPYFPGSMPFATNADLIAQEFVGYNGNPFHGYQLPDLWLNLQKEAALEHPVLLSTDLPTVNPETQIIRYPINMQNVNGSAKPQHLALMEQQLLFLRDAADVFFRDHAIRGPFGHTFVLNTPARFNIGGPAPHTWVYTNDDPNTRWAGYQVRVVESLAEVVRRTAGVEYAEDAHVLAKTQAVNWLNWLNGAWPNLNGAPYKGMPTDFPATGAPQTNYEELHSPAVILRACLLLKAGAPEHAALCDTIATRCWDYMELFWNTTGEMAYTWSPRPADRWWYGFWHAEIIWTLAAMLKGSRDAVPAGIPLATVRDRLLLTRQWLATKGVLDARHRVEVPVTGFRAEVVGADPDWSAQYRVSRAYKTEIFRSPNGREQRRSLRQTPRKTLEWTGMYVADELRDFQTVLSVWQHREFIAPELSRFVAVKSRATNSVDVEHIPGWVVSGSLVALVEGGRAEPLVVDSVDGQTIFFKSSVLQQWGAGVRLCHAVPGRLAASFSLPRPTSNVARGLLALDVTPGSEHYAPHFSPPRDELFPGFTEGPDMYPLPSVPVNSTRVYFYDGEEILLLRNNWGSAVTEGRQWDVFANDFEFGVAGYETDVLTGTRTFSATITCHTAERVSHLQGFFERMRGTCGGFWMPTWENDLPIAGSIAAESYVLRVTANKAARLLLGNAVYRDFVVVTHSRAVYANSITGAAFLGGVATLSLRDPWPEDLSVEDVLMVSWMPSWRLTSDEDSFLWLTSTVSQVVLECRTQFAERYDAEDVAATRRAVTYSSSPYPVRDGDALTGVAAVSSAYMSLVPTQAEEMSADACVSRVDMRSIEQKISMPGDHVSATQAMVSEVSIYERLETLVPARVVMSSDARVVDVVLDTVVVPLTFPGNELDATASVTGVTLT